MKTRPGFWLALSICLHLATPPNAGAADDLPVKRVVLFTSGVAFFQREGEISDNASLSLSFRTEQINDLLKSLVLQDFGGGKIAPVVFGSREPIERTLKSFAIDLTDNPPLAELLNRLRGVEATITAPKEIRGLIVGVETQEQKLKEEILKVHLLNLMTDQGLRAVPLDQIQDIKILDTALDNEFRNALRVLATSHDTQRKPVQLNFTGQGKRRVSVSYILEAPIWKTSYRLELTEKKPPFLQGWAIVENTTDEDWKSVALTLISGRPISFIMDLYQSLYVPRPTVVPETYASLRPPVYQSAMEPEVAAKAEAARPQRMFRSAQANAPVATQALAATAPANFALADSGVSAIAEAGAIGELFQYAIDQPITVERQKSAMLPIINGTIEAEKVSIYNESVQRKFPLNGLQLKNTTGLHLMQGPITVFDDGTYAGDARIEDLQPKEQRLISYALDMKVEVDPTQEAGTNEITSIQIRKGVIAVKHRLLQTRVYTIRNKAAEKRTVLVEHSVRGDWKLLEPPAPSERTPGYYRFRVVVDAAKTVRLPVNEEQLTSESIGVISADINALLLYSRHRAISPKLKEALEKIVNMRNALAELDRHIAQLNQQINDITQEQSRIRENMKVLAQNSELYSRYLKKFDEQETQIEGLRDQIRKLQTEAETQRKQLEDYVNGLEL